MGVVVHSCNAKFGRWGEGDCCKFEVSLGCTVIYSPELTTVWDLDTNNTGTKPQFSLLPSTKGIANAKAALWVLSHLRGACGPTGEENGHWFLTSCLYTAVLFRSQSVDEPQDGGWRQSSPLCHWSVLASLSLYTEESWTKPTTNLSWAETSRPF